SPSGELRRFATRPSKLTSPPKAKVTGDSGISGRALAAAEVGPDPFGVDVPPAADGAALEVAGVAGAATAGWAAGSWSAHAASPSASSAATVPTTMPRRIPVPLSIPALCRASPPESDTGEDEGGARNARPSTGR